MQIIGINGFKRSGKGATADLVEAILADKIVKGVGFADKLKILAAKTLGYIDLSDKECIALMDEAKECWIMDIWRNVKVPDLLLEPYSPNVGRLAPGWQTKEPITQLTGRQYLQHLGNQARIVFGENFWIDQVLPNTTQYDDEDKSDRYDELLEAKYTGVDVLCITDLRYPNEAKRIKTLGGVVWEVLRPGTDSDGHDSEQPLPRNLIDWQLFNEGGIDMLENLVEEALYETQVIR